MIEIIKSSEFNARAVKPIDIKNKIPGYNFSYPVLNTIDICNILMLGGSIEISIERMGKSKWSYNLDTKELTIEKPTSTETHLITNTEELICEMDKYFNQNKDELWKNTYKTNIKKSMSKKAKKNAQKSETSSSNGIDNQNTTSKDKNYNTKKDLASPSRLPSQDYDIDDYGDPKLYCNFELYQTICGKSLQDYFNWLKRVGKLCYLDSDIRKKIKALGINIDKECNDEFYRQNGGGSL